MIKQLHSKKQATDPKSQLKDLGIIKVAQDVHARSIVSCVQEEGQQIQSPRRADPETHLQRMGQLVGRSQKVYSCYEAGPTGFSLHRALNQLGVENVVIAPIRLDERARRVNNDQSDTLTLGSRLDRYVAGNKRIFTVVRVPTEEEEQRRGWTRQCAQLQKHRLSLAAQGRSLALTRGVLLEGQWWKEGPWQLWKEKLTANLILQLEIWRRLMEKFQEEIDQITERILGVRKARNEARPKWAGEMSMERIESEVCDWGRFGSWRKAGSYTGMIGGVSASGEYHRELNITKVGNRRLRTALIEMAWRMCRHQPNYWLSKKWASILGPSAKPHRRARKKAIVAYARQLFVDLWKWKTGRISTERLGWEMVT